MININTFLGIFLSASNKLWYPRLIYSNGIVVTGVVASTTSWCTSRSSCTTVRIRVLHGERVGPADALRRILLIAHVIIFSRSLTTPPRQKLLAPFFFRRHALQGPRCTCVAYFFFSENPMILSFEFAFGLMLTQKFCTRTLRRRRYRFEGTEAELFNVVARIRR